MTAPLSPEIERFVEEEVHSGHFASCEAVIEAALWDMQQRLKETPELKELRRLLEEADEDFETGNIIRFRTVAELRAHAEEVKAAGHVRLGEQSCPAF